MASCRGIYQFPAYAYVTYTCTHTKVPEEAESTLRHAPDEKVSDETFSIRHF